MQLKTFDRNLFLRALVFIKPYKLKFVISIVCVISGTLIGLLQPLIWGKLLTELFTKDYGNIIKLISYIFFLYVLQAGLSYLQSFLFSYLNENIIYDLKQEIFRNTIDLQVPMFDQMGPGAILSRIHEDTSNVANIITQDFINFILDILKVIIIGIIVFAISPMLALITIVSFPIAYFINMKFGNIIKEKNIETMQEYDNYFGVAQETLLGIKEVKALGIKKERMNSFLELSLKIKKLKIGMNIIAALSSNISLVINFATQISIYSVGAYLIFHDLIKMEYFIAFTSYSQQFSASLTNITRVNLSLKKVEVSLRRMFDLIDNFNSSHESFGDRNVERIYGEIKFDNVSFSYPNQKKIFEKICLEINPGKKYVLVGLNGVGKTTLFNLILRYYEPSTGNITIDGINIKEFDENSLREHIALVSQEPTLFNLTIKENLLLANPMRCMDEIIEACEKVNIHSFIESLPNKYDTKLVDNGGNLSGGQRQSIAIARAILKKSKIILFDEATSSLDNESQYCIKNLINDLSVNHTVIIIAHRLLNIVDADEIILVNNGEIVNKGNHEQLIRNNIMYQNLYQKELSMLNEA